MKKKEKIRIAKSLEYLTELLLQDLDKRENKYYKQNPAKKVKTPPIPTRWR